MRYYQSGGGYFPEKSKDSKLKQRNKKRYLKHCENVVKDGDIGSGDYLITQLKLDVERGIEKDYSDSPLSLLNRIHEDKNIIFDSCDEWFSKNMANENCLMTVNVVSLQIAILFTYASLGYNHPTINDWDTEYKEDKKNVNRLFNQIVYRGDDYDWKRFEDAYKYLNENPSSIIRQYFNNGIITVIDFLSVDTIIEQYLDGWNTCQIVYKKTFADRRELLPFEYIWHDLAHYSSFLHFFEERHSQYPTNYTIEKLKEFYDFINTITSVKQRYSVKVIFFILIHESTSKYFDKRLLTGNLHYYRHKLYEDTLVWLERFDREDDLLLLIPEKYRPPKEEEESPKYPDKRFSYLNTALANYLYVLEEFKRDRTIEDKSLDKQRLKRVKDMMTWKEEEDRPIPELLLYKKELEELQCVLCFPTCCLSGGTRNKKRRKRKNKTRKYPGPSPPSAGLSPWLRHIL